MITVLFFASVRERLGCDRLDIDLGLTGGDLEGLLAHLYEVHGDSWIDVLGQENIVCAVNQQVAQGNHQLAQGDEVAYFPPVTGG